jgi:hypothetical protein
LGNPLGFFIQHRLVLQEMGLAASAFNHPIGAERPLPVQYDAADIAIGPASATISANCHVSF